MREQVKAVCEDLSALVDKYAKPGPRYTSYPPANRFVPADDADSLLGSTRASREPLSLYLHIPFCETLCWYCGCHTMVTRNHNRADDYLNRIEQELKIMASELQPDRPLVQMHLGGGTPNFLKADQILRLGEIVSRHFILDAKAEISVELDPRRLAPEQVEAFRQIGVNRASFGIQDCDPDVQKTINREQPHALNIEANRMLREAGMQSINVDLIYGLPQQTCESFERTIEAVLALNPDRITLFSYAHVPWMRPAQKMLEKAVLPTAHEKIALFMQAITQLDEAGMRYIGMDHFARDEDELVQAQRAGTLQRNFQGYSTRAGVEILGLGISSISQSENAYRQNVKDLRDYGKRLDAGELPLERGYVLSEEDKQRRVLIMELMCNLRLDFPTLSERLGVDIGTHFKAEIERLQGFCEDELLNVSEKGIQVVGYGRYFIRNIAMTFDAYLREGEQSYSKTV